MKKHIRFAIWAVSGLASVTPSAGAFAEQMSPATMPVQASAPALVRQGIDMLPSGPALAHLAAKRRQGGSGKHFDASAAAAENPLYAGLVASLVRYREKWGRLPQVDIPSGPALRPGQTGQSVSLLRRRLGLPASNRFDAALASAVRDYKRTHGLADTTLVDTATVASLNLGAAYYERLILLNLERARAIPIASTGRFILVDAAAARLWLYTDGEARDSMKVIVGTTASQTPMLATTIRSIEINPYWNVPPDLVTKLIAPHVLQDGIGYLQAQRYDVLSDWSAAATVVDPTTIDWKAVAEGNRILRVRQRPGETNFMGELKFVTQNELGIFLHDTPNKALFSEDDRQLSNGCVRVEDARRLAHWLIGEVPVVPSRDKDESVPLVEPMPVYITYLTAFPGGTGGDVVFREDRYQRDATAMANLFSDEASRSVAVRDEKIVAGGDDALVHTAAMTYDVTQASAQP